MNLQNISSRFILLSTILGITVAASAQDGGLTLRDAIALALENNRNLKMASLDISGSQQQSKVARSNALPTVSLDAAYAHYFNRPVFFGFGNAANEDGSLAYSRIGGQDQITAALSITQPLYAPTLRSDLDRARLLESKSQLALGNQESEVVATVKQTYLQVLVLHERLKLQQESLKRNKKVLDDARLLYLQGRGLRVDTLRAYTTLKNLQPDILRLTEAIKIAKRHLNMLLGLEGTKPFELTDSLFIATIDVIPAPEQVYEEAVSARQDLQILMLNGKIAHEEVSLAKALRLPTLSLIGQYQVLTQQNDLKLADAQWPAVSFAGLQLHVPLFSGNSHTAKVKAAKLMEQQSGIHHADGLEQLKLDVQRVVANLHEAAERLKTQNIVKETAKLSYDIIQFRYEKGVASRLELADAELALTTAQSNYLEAVYDYLAAHIHLDRVTGKKK